MGRLTPSAAPAERVDLVVIGASVQGLVAAATALRHGRSVVVLDERDTGCEGVETTHPERGWLDWGHAWYSPAQAAMLHAMMESGLSMQLTYLPATHGWLFELQQGAKGSLVVGMSGNDLDFPGGELTLALIGTLDNLCNRVGVDPTNPAHTPELASYDHISAAEFVTGWLQTDPLARSASDDTRDRTRQTFDAAVRSVFSAEPSEVSFLYLLLVGASAGSFSLMVSPKGAFGARFPRGASSLVDALRAQADPDPAQPRVRRGQPISSVTVRPDGCAAVAGGVTYAARGVVLATDPAGVAVTFTDPRDAKAWAAWREAHAAARPGRMIKVFLTYRCAFWREQRQQGTVLATRSVEQGPICWTLDHMWEPQKDLPDVACPAHPASLVAHVVGAAADHWSQASAADRREAVLDQLVRLYGERARTELIAFDGYLERNTAEIPGFPVPVFPPGGHLTRLGTLGAPIGRLGLAPSTPAPEWCGTLEGLHWAGQRAALALLKAL